MKPEYNFGTVIKLSDWARSLPESVDFIDYWYTLFLSKTKDAIDSNIQNRINAFHWTRWQEDFEEYVDGYKPLQGESFDADRRAWFALYSQYLLYALQVSGKQIAQHYGKEIFAKLMDGWVCYHCIGSDQFVDEFVEKYGIPDGVSDIKSLGL